MLEPSRCQCACLQNAHVHVKTFYADMIKGRMPGEKEGITRAQSTQVSGWPWTSSLTSWKWEYPFYRVTRIKCDNVYESPLQITKQNTSFEIRKLLFFSVFLFSVHRCCSQSTVCRMLSFHSGDKPALVTFLFLLNLHNYTPTPPLLMLLQQSNLIKILYYT